jgi:hypothetical protein
VTSVSSSDQRTDATCEQISSTPLVTCPQSADKEGIQGKPGIPNSRSPGTVTSKDPLVGGTSPVMTSRGGLELGPRKPPHLLSHLKTRASGALDGSQSDKNSELPKCVSYSEKPSRFVVRHQEWQSTKKSLIYIHIPGGRRQVALGMGLLGRRPGFSKGGRGSRGRGSQRLWRLLGTFLPLAVGSHPRRRRLLR